MSVAEWVLILAFAGPVLVVAAYLIAMIWGVIYLCVQHVIERRAYRKLHR